jgi:D-threo-aldose 1-dehydrogenase
VTHPAMTSRPLGSTTLPVTPLCVGTSALGSMPRLYGYEVAAERALATLRAVFAGPIRFLDTSNGYAGGDSERLIGGVLAELGGVPEGFLLATKVDPDASGDFSGARVRRSVAESQQRLGLDYLPLVYLHDPERISFESAMGPGGAVDALLSLRQEGTIGHLGVAGGPVDMLGRYVDTGAFEVVLTHNRYTLVDQSAAPLLDQCRTAGVAVVNGAPFGGGILAKGPSEQPRYAYREAPPAVLGAVDRISRICQRYGVPLAAAALQWSIRDDRIASTVVGITRPERVQETVALAQWPIPADLWTELKDGSFSVDFRN